VSRALVLGGGGPVGFAWEAGLLTGLDRGGVDVAGADAVIGTSAGAIAGCLLASGSDLSDAATIVAAASAGQQPQPTELLGQLFAMLAQAAIDPGAAAQIRVRLGSEAIAAQTMSEEIFLEMFSPFAGAAWPTRFVCTAVDTADGSFQVWDADSGVDVQHAIASSCAVPGIFPPVTIEGRRWMDGGMRDSLNADVAAGHDVVLAVSCGLLEVPDGIELGGFEHVLAATRAQLDALRKDGASVETIVPDQEMLELSGWGMNLMDFSLGPAAYEIGLHLGEAEATRIKGF
jgi:NTE family protein